MVTSRHFFLFFGPLPLPCYLAAIYLIGKEPINQENFIIGLIWALLHTMAGGYSAIKERDKKLGYLEK